MFKPEPSTADIILLHGMRNATMLRDPTFRSIDSRRFCGWTLALCLLAVGLIVIAVII